MKPDPFLPQNIADAYAIKSLVLGNADETAMKRAVKCIVEELCGLASLSYDSDSQRATDFNEGKRYVAWCLINLAAHDIEKIYSRLRRKPNG